MEIVQSDMLAFAGSDTEGMLKFQAEKGLAITALYHGQPIAIWGITPLWAGTSEAWFMLEEKARKFAVTMTKIAKLFLSFKFQEHGLHRLQITVRCGDNRAYKWAKAIGFKEEGRMRKYAPDGSDFYIMSIIKGD